jgi:hypothetical protein
LGSDLRSLGDLRGDEKTGELLSLVVQSVVDTLAARRHTELESLEVSLVLLSLGLKRSQESVLSRSKRRVTLAILVRISTLSAVKLLVELDDILQALDVGVADLGQIRLDVVVKVDLDVGVLGLVGEASDGAVVPVPAVWADEGLVVGNLSAVDDGSTGRLDKVDKLQKLLLHILIGVNPEALPRKTKDGALEGLLVSEVLGISAPGSLALLSKGVVVALVNSVDAVENKGGILDGAGKGADRVLVLTLGDDASTGSQADSGLEADEGVAVGGVDDLRSVSLGRVSVLLVLTTAISLGTQRKGDGVGSNTSTATGRATTRVHSKVVRAANLTTASRVTLRVVIAAHISPLTQSSLAEKHSASLAELLDDVRIAGHDATEKSPATSSGLQAVLGSDVVLNGKGNAVERTADLASGTLGIALGGDGEDVGVDLHHGAEAMLVLLHIKRPMLRDVKEATSLVSS